MKNCAKEAVKHFRQPDNDFGTAREACAHYKVHPATLLRWAKNGKVRYKTGLGGRNRMYEMLADYLKNPERKEENVDV